MCGSFVSNLSQGDLNLLLPCVLFPSPPEKEEGWGINTGRAREEQWRGEGQLRMGQRRTNDRKSSERWGKDEADGELLTKGSGLVTILIVDMPISKGCYQGTCVHLDEFPIPNIQLLVFFSCNLGLSLGHLCTCTCTVHNYLTNKNWNVCSSDSNRETGLSHDSRGRIHSLWETRHL